jgi:hypothetical protein
VVAVKIRIDATVDTVPVPVTVRYYRDDPYALHLDITTHRLVRWVIGRELLTAGLTGPAGAADVRVTSNDVEVGVALSTPDGEAMLIFRRADVVEVLRATYVLVPAGQESDALDWSGLARFLGVQP